MIYCIYFIFKAEGESSMEVDGEDYDDDAEIKGIK